MFFSVRTSEIKLALLEWIEVGEGGLDEVCCKPHDVGLPVVLVVKVAFGELIVWEEELLNFVVLVCYIMRCGAVLTRLLEIPLQAQPHFQKVPQMTLVRFRTTTPVEQYTFCTMTQSHGDN